jgi:hypothetical protein
MPDYMYKISTEDEIIDAFNGMVEEVPGWSKANISITKDWCMITYHVYVNFSHGRKYRLACIILNEYSITIQNSTTLNECVFEYSNPRCTARGIAKILDNWIH